MMAATSGLSMAATVAFDDGRDIGKHGRATGPERRGGGGGGVGGERAAAPRARAADDG